MSGMELLKKGAQGLNKLRPANVATKLTQLARKYKRPQGTLKQRQRAWNESATGSYPKK